MFPQAKSFGNILSFTPPGFNQALNVKFPDSRLPVCVSCKKNYKTKDMCRVRNQHTGPPWTTAYICMTLDESCTDEDGNYVDKPFIVRMAQWQPYCVKEDFAPKSKTPVCATCKKTNRTRSFCRDRHKHRKLPWCTVYVLLSTHESADPSTVVAAPSIPFQTKMTAIDSSTTNLDNYDKTKTFRRVIKHGPDQDMIQNEFLVQSIFAQRSPEKMIRPLDESSIKYAQQEESLKNVSTSDNRKRSFMLKRDSSKYIQYPIEQDEQSSVNEGDDINNIPESRTMLIKVSDKETTISWLELSHDVNSAMQGMWQPPLPHQQQQYLPKYSLPSVASASVRVSKRNIELEFPIQAQSDVYCQYALNGYPNTSEKPFFRTGMKDNESPQQHYIYPVPVLRRHDIPSQPFQEGNSGKCTTASSATLPPQQPVPQPVLHQYTRTASIQQRPISPVPVIASPEVCTVSTLSPSVTVTAGEAAAMRRKKSRRGIEEDDYPNLQPPNASPVLKREVEPGALSPGPLQHQRQLQQRASLKLPSQHEHQSWMIYQQMYQAQLQPINSQFSDDSWRINVGTPDNISRSFRHHDESPNNVTTTPGPGDGGDHDDVTDFNLR